MKISVKKYALHSWCNLSHAVEALSHVYRDSDPLFQLAVPLVPVLKLDPQLSYLHERQNVWDPLDCKWGQILLIRQGLSNLITVVKTSLTFTPLTFRNVFSS